jgi:hypothetical protein
MWEKTFGQTEDREQTLKKNSNFLKWKERRGYFKSKPEKITEIKQGKEYLLCQLYLASVFVNFSLDLFQNKQDSVGI